MTMFPFDIASWISHALDFFFLASIYIAGMGVCAFASASDGPRLPRAGGWALGAIMAVGAVAWAGAATALEIEYAAQCGSIDYVLVRDEPHVEQRIIDPGRPDPRIIYVPCGG